jgi:nitrogenase molybdenum-iron protein alpha chain
MMSFAGLNVSLCNVHDDYMLSYLQEKYKIPYIICGMPLGFQATRDWVLEIAEHYGVADRARSLLDAEEAQAREAIAPFLPQIRGKRALICGGVVRTGLEALFLRELGLEVIGVRAYHYDNGADPVLRDLADALPDVPFIVSNQPFEMVNQLRRLKPDLTISHSGTHATIAKAGFVSVPLWDTERPFFGYTGVFSFVRRLAFALKNTAYPARLSKHTPLPYAEAWYEKDSHHYIKD